MEIEAKRKMILEDPLLKVILMISVPVMLTQFIDGLYSIIDTLFIASVGSMEVAIITFVTPIEQSFSAIGTGISIAGASLVARALGAGDFKKATKISVQLMLLGIVVGFMIAIFANVFSTAILTQSSVTENLLAGANQYFRWVMWGVPCWFITIIYVAIRRAEGNTQEMIKLNLYGLVIKLIVSYLLVFVWDFGIMGIALATLVSRYVCAGIAITHFVRGSKERVIGKEDWKFDRAMLKHITWVACPLAMEKFLIQFGFVIVNKYVLMFGEPVLAAYGITNKINSIFFKTTTAFGIGLAVIVAQNLGAKKSKRAMEAIQKTIGLALGFAVISVLCLVPWRAQIASMFVETTDPVHRYIVQAMGIYTLSIIPWAVTEVMMGVFQGCGKTGYNLAVSLVRIYIFRVPIIMLLVQPWVGIDQYAIWYGMLISNILSALCSYLVYRVRRQQIGLTKEELTVETNIGNTYK